jgi:hypothetical protein
MKYRCFPSFGSFLSAALLCAALTGLTGTVAAQEKKSGKSKAPLASKPGPGAAKPAAAAGSKYDQILAANLKLLNVLSRYADTLSGATDTATAGLALNQIETITKEAITAGEELVKLGKATPEMEAKLAKNPDLEVTSRRVAEQTRSAVKALAANPEVKAILTPAIENFQSAINRLQQDADDPKGPGVPIKPKSSLASASVVKPPKTSPAPAPAPATENKDSRASEASSVPPPPPPQ